MLSIPLHFDEMAAPASSPKCPNGEGKSPVDLSTLPPIKLAIRSNHGVELRSGPLSSLTPSSVASDSSAAFDPSCNGDGQLLYTKDGSKLALKSIKEIRIVDTATMKDICVIPRGRVEYMWFSPRGTFLCSWERKTAASAASENLHVWRTADGESLFKLHMNECEPNSFKPIQWTEDDVWMVTMVSNEIKLFHAAAPQLASPALRLRVPGVAQFALAPAGKPNLVAAFTPSKGTDPAKVAVYPLIPGTGCAGGDGVTNIQAQASKSFFKAEEVALHWSPIGHAVLIETRTSTDKTGKSYYGESGVHLLHADGSYSGTVPFGTNAGPVQDVAWSPTGKEFLVIQGFQPAKTTLFQAANCTPLRDYGTNSRNTIRWSPHGRFVMLGGFGNLAGGMEFWDHFKFRKLGECVDRDGAKSFEWTPDGRNFITASLRPWRRVDNGYKVWTYAGEQVYAEKYEELYQVVVQPAPVGIYPSRPPSPRVMDRLKAAAQGGADKGAASAAAAAAPAKPSAYIPPHLRAKGATAPSSIMKRETVSAPKKLTQEERAAITGQAVPSKEEEGGLSKSAWKRQKQKEREQKKKAEEEAKAAEEAALRQAEEAKKNDLSDPSVIAKKIKVVSKKLRQITDLKEKQQQGTELNEDQLNKLKAEEELNEEMKQLTVLAQKASE